jgi:hypothetical protein
LRALQQKDYAAASQLKQYDPTVGAGAFGIADRKHYIANHYAQHRSDLGSKILHKVLSGLLTNPVNGISTKVYPLKRVLVCYCLLGGGYTKAYALNK